MLIFSLDHRRLKAMRDSGFKVVRLRTALCHPILDEFVQKGLEKIGMRPVVGTKGQEGQL